jgi:hypothetical protein
MPADFSADDDAILQEEFMSDDFNMYQRKVGMYQPSVETYQSRRS